MQLQYDVSIIGMGAIKRATADIERMFVRHNRALQKRAKKMAQGPLKGAGGVQLDAEQKRHGLVMRNLGRERAAMVANSRAMVASDVRAARVTHAARLRQARKEAAARVKFVRAVGGGTANRIGSVVRSVGAFGAMAVGLGGGMVAASALSGMTSKDKASRALANQAFGTSGSQGKTREQMNRDILDVSQPIAMSSGIQQAEVIGGMRQFMSKAGDIDAAKKIAPFLADLSDASETSMTDAGEAAGQIFMSAIAQGLDSDAALKATKDILGVMGGQAKEGAIELKDMATQAGKLMSAAGQFGGNIAGLANTMGAVGQMAIAGGASSPDEAMTALMRLPDDVVKNHAKFKRAGIDVFTDKSRTALRDPGQLIMESVAQTGGDMTKLNQMFGLRAKKAVDPFRKAYVEAGGGDKGKAAMEAMFARFTSLAMTQDEVKTSAAFTREGTSKKFDIIKERIDQKIGPAVMRVIERLIPAFEKLIPSIERGAEALASFIEWFADNPLEGVGTLLGATLVAEIGKAAIGSAVSAAITAAMSGGAGAVSAGVAGIFTAFTGAIVPMLGIGLVAALAIAARNIKGFAEGKDGVPTFEYGTNEEVNADREQRAAEAISKDQGVYGPQDAFPGIWEGGMEAESAGSADYLSQMLQGKVSTGFEDAHSATPDAASINAAYEQKKLGTLPDVMKEFTVKGGDQFQAAAEQMGHLPSALDSVLARWASKGPNRGDDPTGPRR